MTAQSGPSFEKVATIPSHISPPPPGGLVYFTVDRQHYQVEPGSCSGADLRALTRNPLSEEHPLRGEWDLWRVVPGGDDIKVEPSDVVELDRSGFRFFSAPRYITGGA